jgi:hypothetical protein
MNDIISLMQEKPHVDHTTLRAMLMKYVPDFKSLDGTFLCNFRRRAMKYVYDPNMELTTPDTWRLLRIGPVAAAEELDIDNPIIQMNFLEFLRKIIQESSQTWEVIRHLSHLKEICPGFEYRIKKDSHGRPE